MTSGLVLKTIDGEIGGQYIISSSGPQKKSKNKTKSSVH